MSSCRAFQRKIQIQTLKTYYFTLTHDCRIGSPGKAGEGCRARLHTTVGCSHGDGRRKYDSKRPSSHVQAYVKVQSVNITSIHCLYVCIVHYHVNSGQISNAVCGSDPPPTSCFLLLPTSFSFSLF